MSKKKAPSKFDCDSALFNPEPPTDPKLVKDLFHGREKDLQRGLETLKSQVDIDAKRSKNFDKRPWVIHGESRCGKSHLARRIFADLPKNDRRIQLIVSARERIEALAVMGKLFRELVGHFRRRTHDQRLDKPVDQEPDVRDVDRLIEKIELLLNEAQSATITTERAGEATLEFGGELSGLFGKLLGKYQSKDTEKNARQFVLKPPTPSTLAEACGVMVETLLRWKLVRHLLVLVDDVDLLEGYKSDQQNGVQQRTLLAEALCELHGQPGIDVVLTARSWYHYSAKDLQTLVDLTDSPLPASALVAIHDLHMTNYAKKSGISRFLRPEALQEVAGKMDGLPGVFLQWLAKAFYQYQNDDTWDERDYDWFLGVFRRMYDEQRHKCKSAADLLEQAAQTGRLEMDVSLNNPFFGTVFDNLLVFQSYYNERCYFAPPLVTEILPSLAPIPAPAITGGTP